MSKTEKIGRFFDPLPRQGTDERVELRMMRLEHHAEEFRREQAEALLSVVKGSLEEYPREKAEEAIGFYERAIPMMPLPMIIFISSMLQSAGRSRSHNEGDDYDKEAMAEEAARVHASLTDGRHQRYDFIKTDGALELLEAKDGIIFKHAVRTAGAIAWREAAQHVPVAPILKEGDMYPDEEVIFSRYSGFSFSATRELLERTFPEIVEDLVMQRFRIVATLNNNQILHGHPHDSNFTVEFIRKDALRRHAEGRGMHISSDAQLRDPELLNSLPFQKNDVIFDVVDFMRHKEEFIAVVRVIDFDLARMMPETSPERLREMEIRKGNLDVEEIRKFMEVVASMK